MLENLQFQWEDSQRLWMLVAIPLLTGVFYYWRKKWLRRERGMGQTPILQRMRPYFSYPKHRIKFLLVMIAWAFLVLAWANPQGGSRTAEITQQSTDVFIALDISNSMRAEDIEPSRIDRARQFALSLVRRLKGERIGLILFAGSAYIQMPLTTDYSAAEVFINSANPSMSSVQGTAIGDAIAQTLRAFEEEEQAHRLLLIISDGENHEGEALNKAQEAREAGLTIFTIGAATSEGGYIPIPTRLGGVEFKRNPAGELIRSRLNEDMLTEIAVAADGDYFHLLEGEDILRQVERYVENMDKTALRSASVRALDSYFFIMLWPAFLFLLADFLISYRKTRWSDQQSVYGS